MSQVRISRVIRPSYTTDETASHASSTSLLQPRTHLTGGLMLELVVFAQEILAEAALENAPSEIPDSALALGANHVRQRTRARVSLKTLPTVTNKRLAEVTNGAHHTHA